MTYKIVDGYVIHQPPVYPLDDDGIPTFLKGIDRIAWKARADGGLRQTRYSADGFHPPRGYEVGDVVSGKAYVCYKYSAEGREWSECGWESVE